MTVSQFFDPEIRQWAQQLLASSLTGHDLETRVHTFREYATDRAQRFEWNLETALPLNVRERFEEHHSTLQEARDYLEWATDEFCDALLERAHEHIIRLEPTRPAHVTKLDWPVTRGGDAA